jgi:hypothetical protein
MQWLRPLGRASPGPLELTNLADDPKHKETRAQPSKLIAAYSYPT